MLPTKIRLLKYKEVLTLDKFANYLQRLDITQTVTDEEVKKTEKLLRVYSPMLRSTVRSLDEFEEACYEGHL